MRLTRSARQLCAALLIAMLPAGCGPHSATTSTASGTGGTVAIGIDLPTSGGDASDGIPTRNGAVLAIEQANQKTVPGGFRFAADDLDDAVQGTHDPAQGAQNARTFVSDSSVLAMIGPFNSNVAEAEIPITNATGLVQISPATVAPGLTQGEAAARLRTAQPNTNNFFRVCTTSTQQATAAARFARTLHFSHAYVIDDNESYGKGLADLFAADFAKAGGTVLGHEHLTRNQQDFTALLTKAASLHPDIVYYGGTTVTGGGLVRKQMGDVGLANVAFMGGDGISDAQFITVAGTMANGTYYTVAAPDATKLPSARAFVADYHKRWGTAVGPYSANAYAAVQVAVAAAEKAIRSNGDRMPTRLAVRRNVATTREFPTPIGKIGFDKNGDTLDPILSLYEIKNGKAQFVNQIALNAP